MYRGSGEVPIGTGHGKPKRQSRVHRPRAPKESQQPQIPAGPKQCPQSPTGAHHWIEYVMGSNHWTCKWCDRQAEFQNKITDHLQDPYSPMRELPTESVRRKPVDWTPMDHLTRKS